MRGFGFRLSVELERGSKSPWCLVRNGGMDYGDYYWGLYRGYYRDPFHHSLLSTREKCCPRRGWGARSVLQPGSPHVGFRVRCLGLTVSRFGINHSHGKAQPSPRESPHFRIPSVISGTLNPRPQTLNPEPSQPSRIHPGTARQG